MHRLRSGIVVGILAAVLIGCSDSSVDEGPRGFTPTDTKPLDPMLKQMQDTMKKKDYTKRQGGVEKEKKKETEKKK